MHETKVPGEKTQTCPSHWQTLKFNYTHVSDNKKDIFQHLQEFQRNIKNIWEDQTSTVVDM